MSDGDAERCRALVIPPAWTEVWICPYANGHLQAVGVDDAGRRQYLYHPRWVEQRSTEKHARVVQFGRRLPTIRSRVADDLGSGSLDLAAACAVAVRMLDLGCFRIGSDVYAAENGSFGLTTLERRHVRRRAGRLLFDFMGKSGVEHHIEIDDATVVDIIDRMRRRAPRGTEGSRRSEETPLLGFRDGRTWHSLTPVDVNEYLRSVSGLEASAKDFRTWHGTVLAAIALAEAPEPTSDRAARRTVTAAVREVADYLGNTPALARSAYIDPRVIDAFEERRTIRAAVGRSHRGSAQRQAAVERATLRLLVG